MKLNLNFMGWGWGWVTMLKSRPKVVICIFFGEQRNSHEYWLCTRNVIHVHFIICRKVGTVVRALASHHWMWPGFDSRSQRHMWVEFVIGSRPCPEGFSPGSPFFLLPQKSSLLNSNSISKQWKKSHFMEMSLQIPIYFIIFILFRSVMRHSWPSSTNIVSGIHTLRAERARSSCQTLPCHTTVSD